MTPEFFKYAKRFGIDLEKLTGKLTEKLNKVAVSGIASPETQSGGGKPLLDTSSSLAKALLGPVGGVEEYHFPAELIGGCCPRVVGAEEDIAWNAAAEACDSERIHIVWQSMDNRIWYIAVRSSELSSHAESWCPFAALLPGMKDAQPAPVCYTFYSDESATMMTITADGLQIHRGMTSVVRAKAERTARELGDAPIIELVPDRIVKLTPVPWYSLSLFEERARRVLATVAVAGALCFAVLAFVIWFFSAMMLISAKADLDSAEARTASKTLELMRMVGDLRASPMREELAKFSDVNDGLLELNGLLDVYEIKDNKPRWRATVPVNVTADRINALGGKTISTNDQDVVIGNTNEIEYEAANAGKKR